MVYEFLYFGTKMSSSSLRSIFYMAVLDLKYRCSDELHRPS